MSSLWDLPLFWWRGFYTHAIPDGIGEEDAVEGMRIAAHLWQELT